MQQAAPSLSQSLSFNGSSPSRLAEIAARVVDEFKEEEYDDVFYSTTDTYTTVDETPGQQQSEEKDKGGERNDVVEEEINGDEEDKSEFEFVVLGRDEGSSLISADEIFYDGQIRPIFPIFNTDLVYGTADWNPEPQNDRGRESRPPNKETIRLPLKKLLIEERETATSSSSSEADDLENVPPGTYCVWTPKLHEMRKKSNSTGYSKRWKFRDLLHRSSSDGKDTFVFLTPKHHQISNATADKRPADRKSSAGEERARKAHQAHQLENRAMRSSDRRKSYLPYRQDLVGFFANAHGLSRAVQPF
ncbi:hypothetical protein Nepgr_003119 [Nepenthes gracilis]|uniref:Uncharacterized protein n=1 Tax=Nepenthes gracilis TaxID=150966 RepID=A0AAD3RYX3_NEPGR|nr:hypothetical protein Nepgr_003119 [Nepenthes gracilis]